jgi:hypothetical protein
MTETGKQKRERLKATQVRKERERFRTSQYGKLGAASAVRKIDPKTGKVIEVIEPKGRR